VSITGSMIERTFTVTFVAPPGSGSKNTTPTRKLSETACHAMRRSGTRMMILTSLVTSSPLMIEVHEKIGVRRKNQMRSRYQPPKASGATSNPEFPSLRFFILYFLTLRIGRQGCPRAITMRPIPEHL
jgi:hypothetical protein